MKIKQLDKYKTSIASLTTLFAFLLQRMIGGLYTVITLNLDSTSLVGSLILVGVLVLITLIIFTCAYNGATRWLYKSAKVKIKEMCEMGLTVALAYVAVDRALRMFHAENIVVLSAAFIIFTFVGAYSLIPEKTKSVEGEILPTGKQTVYRKEKVIQKGSKADGLLSYAFAYAWGCGIIFTYGGFIVRPRNQAPGFFGIGFVCLLLAMVWTKQKIDDAAIESYKKIILPSYWPKDCSYEKYHLGLNAKGSKTSGGLFGDKNMKFYNACRTSGVSDLDSDFNMEKAMEIAKNQKIKEFNKPLLREMFEKGKEMIEADQQSASQASTINAQNKIRIEELNEMAEGLRYYGLQGMEKRKAMLRALMREANQKRKDAEMMANMASRTMLQKEHDWAVHGGIASGIAGPVAGVATALDIQAKNAVIREQNAKMMPYVAMVSASYSNTATGYQQEYNRYAADLRACNTKLVSKDSKETVMENIIISEQKYKVSSTGAVTVEARFEMNPNYRIFGTKKPTIDGCVACRLMQGDECKGSAYFVFPVEGIVTPTKLKALCTKTTDPQGEYTLVFEADSVWAMEKL